MKESITYYGGSQCALRHSMLSVVKLFFGINIQGNSRWVIFYKLFCTSCHPGQVCLRNHVFNTQLSSEFGRGLLYEKKSSMNLLQTFALNNTDHKNESRNTHFHHLAKPKTQNPKPQTSH